MTDITYQTGSSDTVTHGATHLARILTYCSRFVEGACEGQQMAARYHELSRLSGADLAARGLTRQTLGRAVLTGH